MYCQEFWILNYTWLTWRRWSQSLVGCDRLKNETGSQLVPKPVNFPDVCETWALWRSKHRYMPQARAQRRRSVMRDFISCTCHSLPSRALQNWENSPCWSRSVNSLMFADVCWVTVTKHLHITLLPWKRLKSETLSKSFYCWFFSCIQSRLWDVINVWSITFCNWVYALTNLLLWVV